MRIKIFSSSTTQLSTPKSPKIERLTSSTYLSRYSLLLWTNICASAVERAHLLLIFRPSYLVGLRIIVLIPQFQGFHQRNFRVSTDSNGAFPHVLALHEAHPLNQEWAYSAYCDFHLSLGRKSLPLVYAFRSPHLRLLEHCH